MGAPNSAEFTTGIGCGHRSTGVSGRPAAGWWTPDSLPSRNARRTLRPAAPDAPDLRYDRGSPGDRAGRPGGRFRFRAGGGHPAPPGPFPAGSSRADRVPGRRRRPAGARARTGLPAGRRGDRGPDRLLGAPDPGRGRGRVGRGRLRDRRHRRDAAGPHHGDGRPVGAGARAAPCGLGPRRRAPPRGTGGPRGGRRGRAARPGERAAAGPGLARGARDRLLGRPPPVPAADPGRARPGGGAAPDRDGRESGHHLPAERARRHHHFPGRVVHCPDREGGGDEPARRGGARPGDGTARAPADPGFADPVGAARRDHLPAGALPGDPDRARPVEPRRDHAAGERHARAGLQCAAAPAGRGGAAAHRLRGGPRHREPDP